MTITIVIPTLNSERTLKDCLSSIRDQNVDEVEIIIVDNLSTDKTRVVAAQYGAKILTVGPRISNFFAAPIQRKMGADEAQGEHLYFADSDMVLLPGLLKECLSASRTYDALVIPEHSVGSGVWAHAKIAEHECNVGDFAVEAPRFVSKIIYEKVGKWPQEAGAFDDWAFRDKLVGAGVGIGRTNNYVLHNEGALKLSRLLRKRLIMGMSSRHVPKMSSQELFHRLSPARLPSVVSGLSKSNPNLIFPVLSMKSLEGLFFHAGRLYARNKKVPNRLYKLQD
jgi:glycosyltransferase involved in cell wall biosynthesis